MIDSFISTRCVSHSMAQEPAQVLYASYVAWCRDTGHHADTMAAFTAALLSRGYGTALSAYGTPIYVGIGGRTPTATARFPHAPQHARSHHRYGTVQPCDVWGTYQPGGVLYQAVSTHGSVSQPCTSAETATWLGAYVWGTVTLADRDRVGDERG